MGVASVEGSALTGAARRLVLSAASGRGPTRWARLWVGICSSDAGIASTGVSAHGARVPSALWLRGAGALRARRAGAAIHGGVGRCPRGRTELGMRGGAVARTNTVAVHRARSYAARPLVDAERQGSAVARGPVVRGGCKAHGATGVVPAVSVVHRCLPDRDGSNAIENKRSTFYQPEYKQLGGCPSGCDRVEALRRAARLIAYFGGCEPHFRDWSIWAVNGKTGAAARSRNDR